MVTKEFVTVNLEDIKPYPNNPRINDKAVDDIVASIQQCENLDPIEIDENGVILSGHTRLKALKRLKYTETECIRYSGLTEEQKRKYRLLANKTGEKADWDLDMLADELQELDFGDFDFGFDMSVFDEPEEVTEDNYTEENVEPRTKVGDLWQLGNHRLICGDSTDVTVIDRLMDGQKADLLITDPPYNVSLGQDGGHALRPSEAKQLHRRTDGLVIQNDSWKDEDEFIEFLTTAFQSALSVMRAGAVFYIWYADTQALNFRLACKNADMKIRENLIWNKNVFAMGRQDYQWKHEPCLYGWKEGASHLWASDRKQSTVIDFNKPSRSELHPTMKPVGLFAYQIGNNTHENDAVLDIFGGSGTTLIACEQLNRKCYMCELDPRYVDVIIDRWEKFTGKKAVELSI